MLPGALEGRPPAAETSPLQARIDAAVAGSTVEVGPGEYAGDLILDKPLRLVGRGRPRLRGVGPRQRRPRAGRRRHDRGLRDRRAPRGRPLPGLGGGPQRRPRHDAARPRDPRRALRRLPARGERRRGRALPGARDPRQGPRREGLGHPRVQPGGLPVRRQRGRGRARRPLPPERLEGDLEPQRGARRALRAPLHVLGRQRVRGQHLRERGGGHRHHVLGAPRLPPQPLPPEPRLRVGGPPLPGLRRRPRRGQPGRGQRPGRLHRGLAPGHPPRQRDRRLRRGGGAVRPERGPPLRGQLLRRQHVAARPRGAADRHRVHGQLLVRATTSPTSTATAGASGPTASPASSTTSGGT